MKRNSNLFKREPTRMEGAIPVFLDENRSAFFETTLEKGLINKLKKYFKNWKWFYRFLFYVISPAYYLGEQEKKIFKYVPSSARVAEIGSGDRRLGHTVMNIDIYPWKEVDIVADIHDLPFVDESLDGVVVSWVVEHLIFPEKAVREIERVLKRGGYVYLSTNFVFPYHSSPDDFYRWSRKGLAALLRNFEIVEMAPAVGPTSAMLSVFQEWISIALSCNVKVLKDAIWIIVVVLTFPLKYLDIILGRFRTGESIAAGFYCLARKR